jgi:hypothetical protein
MKYKKIYKPREIAPTSKLREKHAVMIWKQLKGNKKKKAEKASLKVIKSIRVKKDI